MADSEPTSKPSTGLYEQPVLVLDPGMHTAPIRRMDVDAAGKLAVTGSHDGTVRVWSVGDGQLLRTIRVPQGPGHVGRIIAVAISPDGRTVAAGGWTGTAGEPKNIVLFDAESGVLTGRIDGLSDVVFHLAFSPDGRRLVAVLGGPNGLRLYNRDMGWAEIARDEDYGDHSYGATFATDGRLATTCYDGKVRLYDGAGKKLTEVETEFGRPAIVDFSPDGCRLAVGFEDVPEVRLHDGATLAPLLSPDTNRLDNGNLVIVAWSADGTTLYAGGTYDQDGISPVMAWAEGGAGLRRALPASTDIIMSLRGLADGDLLVAAGNPWLGRLPPDGTPRWTRAPRQMDGRDQDKRFGLSADGLMVDFGYRYGGEGRARFDLTSLTLTAEPPHDGRTVTPRQEGLGVDDWYNCSDPTLYGRPLLLRPYEVSISLAIHPDEERFLLGTHFYLRAFDAAGQELWRRPAPGAIWAVNISGDGRLALAAYGDGTLRWHRVEDGAELLALFPMIDGTNWVAWTPEGFYAATPGAFGVLRWHVNHGWDQAAEAVPVDEIKELYRPDALPLVLQEMETARALGLADMERARRAVQRRTGSAFAPGQRLHVLAMGISDYGAQAQHLRLQFADRDAWDAANALVNTQGGFYADVSCQALRNDEVTQAGLFQAFAALREELAQSEPGRDLAVVLFSGHGGIVDDGLYFYTHGIDDSTEASLKATALPVSDFRDELRKLGEHGRVLVLLDACHSGGATGDDGCLPMNADLLRTALATTNVTVLTSSSAEEPSREDERWQNGAFTEVFLEALTEADTNKDGLISVSDLTAYLSAHVPRITDNKQTPGVEARFQGDVFAAGLSARAL